MQEDAFFIPPGFVIGDIVDSGFDVYGYKVCLRAPVAAPAQEEPVVAAGGGAPTDASAEKGLATPVADAS